MKTSLLITIPALLALAACSGANEEPAATQTSEADAFAERINGNKTAQAASAPVAAPAPATPSDAPTVAAPLENVSSNPVRPGTATDPKAACNANAFGEFLGREPDAAVRAEIMEAASGLPEVRFIAPGADFVNPDPTNPRLNFMIAADGIIRDIRCG